MRSWNKKFSKGFLGTFILYAFTTIAFSNTITQRAPVNWQPIYGLNKDGISGYIDLNSHINISQDNTNVLNTADVLISYDKPTEITVGSKKLVIRSMVKSLIVECKSGIMAPIYDIYFKEAFPTRETLPLSAVEYTQDIKSIATALNKNTVLFRVMCPEYI